MRLPGLPVWRTILLISLGLTASAPTRAADYFPPPDRDGGWRTLTDPAEIRNLAGMDFDRLERAFDFTQRCSQNGGLLVVRHGYLVFERDFCPAPPDADPPPAPPRKAHPNHP